jgi:outer membrane receptor for ferrienterochelin and colicins
MRSVIVLIIAAVVTAAGSPCAVAQSSPDASPDTSQTAGPTASAHAPVEMDEVVVTATKTRSVRAAQAVPASVVSGEAIEQQGDVRLADVLSAEPGLMLDYDHGAGLQIQGLGTDYTLILIDGQPVVGRTAGTLDLERISVRGVERVEVVRGPSSSLYGNEALAGVVNVITETPDAGVRGSVRTRHGTHNTSDIAARLDVGGRTRASVSLQRYASGGYDLVQETTAPTVPRFADYTGRFRLQHPLGDRTEARLRVRSTHRRQSNRLDIAEEPATLNEEALRTDWSVTPSLTHAFGSGLNVTGTLYASGFHTDRDISRPDGSLFDGSTYDQFFYKADLEASRLAGTRHYLTGGAGVIRESVTASRVDGDRIGGFVFLQDEWQVNDRLTLTPSARLDAHSDYATRLSPKVAALFVAGDRLQLRASFGSGYKAPAFRQLYLSYTNPRVGYTVLGAEYVQDELAALRGSGQIASALRDPATLGSALEAERSMAFNAGFDAVLGAVDLSVNAFHNEVSGLIDTEPVATKTNGQQVFTYVNRGSVYTRGVETEVSSTPLDGVEVRLSYTFLQARDRDLLDDLRAGRVYRRTDSGRDVQVPEGDYGGLTGRSRHAATLNVRYALDDLGLTASVQGRYRGRYPFADQNGNGLVDVATEYAPGHAVLDLALTQRLFDDHALAVGLDNATGHRDALHTPHLSGREWYAELRLSL